jgi:beta-phosphoglucomutase
MISAILWDMDGVLVETSAIHYQSWVVAFKQFGYEFNQEYFLQFYGMNDASTIRGVASDSVTPELIHSISEYKEIWFRDHIKEQIQLLPGVFEWLNKFKIMGYQQAVASSGPMENIEMIVTITKIRSYFSALVSCADGPTKPDPWVFLKAAACLKATPEECVVIEDTPNGIGAARSAGMPCLAVTTSNPAKSLGQADLVISNLARLSWSKFENIFIQERNKCEPK